MIQFYRGIFFRQLPVTLRLYYTGNSFIILETVELSGYSLYHVIFLWRKHQEQEKTSLSHSFSLSNNLELFIIFPTVGFQTN